MPTINDIAKACKLSKATVSYVINNSDLKVSAKTRARVLQTVREMNYYPSAHALSLSRRRANMIGIVTPHLANPLELSYFSVVIHSIVNAAQQLDQSVILYNDRVWKDSEQRVPIFGDGRCDGLIVISDEIIPGMHDALALAPLPYVIINGGEHLDGVSSIDIDNTDAARQMTRFLIEKGHRRIAFLHANTEAYYSRRRLAGYKAALEDAGIAYDACLELPGRGTRESATERAVEITSNSDLGVTALFCATDRVALWAMHALMNRGVRVPQDISVAGINDLPEGAMVNPPLTTVSQMFTGMGERATKLLLELIDKPDQTPRSLIHPTELVVRDSVALVGAR